MFILTINYGIAKVGKASRLTPVLTWVFNMGVLFANERNEGYRFSSLSPSLEFLVLAFELLSHHQSLIRPAGLFPRSISSLVHPFQHHYAPTCVVQHGLPLGLQGIGVWSGESCSCLVADRLMTHQRQR